MAVVFGNVWMVTCFETYKKCVYFGGLQWCRRIFQIYPIMHYGRKLKFKLKACCLVLATANCHCDHI